MAEKKKIALVSITINAVGPMTDYIAANHPELRVTNYLDGFLMEKIKQEGGITDESMGRMLHMLTSACRDGNDVIIITCTVFTKYREQFEKLFSLPIISADSAMLTETASHDGRTAIIYSFPGTYNTTLNGYRAACAALGRPDEVDMVLAEGAFEAAQNGNLAESDRIVREKILALDGQYDNIALAQISLAGAAQGVALNHASLFSSPACAVRSALKLLAERG